MELDIISPSELAAAEALRRYGVEFIRIKHAPADTMELCRGIGAEYGARHCKNLFLTNRSGNEFHLLLMDPEKPYRTSEVSKKLGVSRLSFGTPEQLMAVLGLTPGCVSILGMLNECAAQAYAAGRLHIAIDEDVLKWERICVHPNTDTATFVVKTAELVRLLYDMGFEFSAVEV